MRVTVTSRTTVRSMIRVELPELEVPEAGCGIWMTMTGGEVGADSGEAGASSVEVGEGVTKGAGVGVADGVGLGSTNDRNTDGDGLGDEMTATGLAGSGEATTPTAMPMIAEAASAAVAGTQRMPPPVCDSAGQLAVSFSGCVNRPFA